MAAAGNGGSIVNVASIEGVRAAPGYAAYAAAKAGVLNFTKTAALELAPHGIRVNALAPDITWTEGLARLAAAGGDDPAERRARDGAHGPARAASATWTTWRARRCSSPPACPPTSPARRSTSTGHLRRRRLVPPPRHRRLRARRALRRCGAMTVGGVLLERRGHGRGCRPARRCSSRSRRGRPACPACRGGARGRTPRRPGSAQPSACSEMSMPAGSRPASSTQRQRWSSMGARSSTVSSTGVFAVRASVAGGRERVQPSPDVATRRRDRALLPPIQIGTCAGLGLAVWPRAVKWRPS